MKIKQAHIGKRKKRKLRWWHFLLLFILLSLAGLWVVNEQTKGWAKEKGYNSIVEIATVSLENYLQSKPDLADTLELKIENIYFDRLSEQSANARERGLLLPADKDYVPADLKYKGDKMDVELRLKGHMSDHVQKNKWSFRVKVRDDLGNVDGMRRFTLQHPGTRMYIYEWIYHQLLDREDVFHLRYKFLRVKMNGEDWGIYALEENFQKELVAFNNRPPGPLFRFNADPYWVDRYNALVGERVRAENADYSSSFIEVYRDENVYEDKNMLQKFTKATALLEAFRRNELPSDSVFDIERMAKMHAMIDLVGGHHSLDWSDVKFYYNPVTSLIEPVGYESFSGFPVKYIAGSYQYRPGKKNYGDYHQNLFSNEKFFRAYIRNLERIASDKYLDDFFAAVDSGLQANLQILYSEFPYKDFNKNMYYRHAKMIRKILQPSKSFHAFLEKTEEDSIVIQLGQVDALPVEITAIDFDGEVVQLENPVILPSKPKHLNTDYRSFAFKNPDNDFDKDDIEIIYKILGSGYENREKVLPYPFKDKSSLKGAASIQLPNVEGFDFLVKNDSEKVVTMLPGAYSLQKILVIPTGYQFLIPPGTNLNLENNAGIIIRGPLIIKGISDQPVRVASEDGEGKGILVMNANEVSEIEYAEFSGLKQFNNAGLDLNGVLNFYEADVNINNAAFTNFDSEDAIDIIRSDAKLNNVTFSVMNNDAVDLDFSQAIIKNCSFYNMGEDAIDATSTMLTLRKIKIDSAGNKGLNLKAQSHADASNLSVSNSLIALSAEDMGVLKLSNSNISDCKVGLTAYQNKGAFGPAEINARKITFKNVENHFIMENNSIIRLDGVLQKESGKKVETRLKDFQKAGEE